ncbi:protein phosphatase 1 regulatory subunit 3A [Plectropomus leopardus]|uniref:protein phosphatase 1 regulatory subunit 3A n=1 Tax=Plectropomus leopardus TaxID=160734 RepID=UPI001C4C1972|nr:protein phosphatase 1 regulatory subunit 3A [Plectropomus leopardus]
MSSVTRLHLLSRSMLNVSCQQQTLCSSLPADSSTESPMEFVGQPRVSGACSLLGVPGLSSVDVDDDDCEVVIGIRPKSSPLPRRRSCDSDEDSEFEPPPLGSRRVSFADAKGLSLVQVKEFGTWDDPILPVCDSSEGKGRDTEEYFLSPLTFSLPLSTEELFVKVREQKVELETIELIPGTTVLKGVIRVLNISFNKAVYIRTTLDAWSSHFDLLAEYIGSSDSLMDLFSFKITLVPPFGEQGARVDFCLRYETPLGTFWANNNDRNYVLFCHQRVKERKEKPQKESMNKKSCLKTASQSFSTVENAAPVEASKQENIATVVSKREGKADAMKDVQISDGQSTASEEERQKLLAESRQNCSRKSRRRAARMARVRDYFSQKNDTGRDESPSEVKQVTIKETSEEKHLDVRSFTEGISKSEASVSLETCSEPLLDVTHDTSPDYTSNSEAAKSDNSSFADSATLTGGESATDFPSNPSNDEPAPAENINKSVSKAKDSNAAAEAAEPADSDISAVSSHVGQTNSFTFGTVVAPLYHQVFGRVGSESQSVCDLGNSVPDVGNSTQSYPHTEKRQTSCTLPTNVRDNNDKVKGNAIETQESAAANSPPMKEDETNLSTTANNIVDYTETLQDPLDIMQSDQSCMVPKMISGDTEVHPNTVNVLNTDLLHSKMHIASLNIQVEEKDDNLTKDVQLPEHTCRQTKEDESIADTDVMTSPEASFMSCQPSESVSERFSDETNQQISDSGANHCKCVQESNKDNVVGKTALSTANGLSEEDNRSAALNVEHISNSATRETENSHISCFLIVEENDITSLQVSPETNDVEDGNAVVSNLCKDEFKTVEEIAESTPKAMISNHIHGDVLMELKDEDAQKTEHREMEAAVSKQEDFCLLDTTEVKNWEMMVEEEEGNILPDGEEYKTESVEKDQGQLDDAGTETTSEKRDTTVTEKEKTEDEMVKFTAAGEKENQAEDSDVLEEEQTIEETEIMTGEHIEEVEKELEYVQATKIAGEEELSEVIEEEEREEQEKTETEEDKLSTVIQEINIERMNSQEGEEIEEREEIEIDLKDDYDAHVKWEYQIKPKDKNFEEENPEEKEGIVVDKTRESEVVDAESESMIIEDRVNEAVCFEERLGITQNKPEDGLFAPVNSVQDKRAIDKDNTGGQNGHIPNEMHLYKYFHSIETVTHDLTRAESDESDSAAAEGSSCILRDEPESDQESNDSASAESDSDDEVELYMHCLRAVHAGAQAQKDRNKDIGFSVGKRPSVSRSKRLSIPMPSISESLDEEQHLSHLLDNHEDMEMADFQPTVAALPASNGQESINRTVSWWKETFSCSNISKTLLYATFLVVFFVVAHRYDFLACFGLYLMSAVWLFYQGDRQPEQQKQQQNRLN